MKNWNYSIIYSQEFLQHLEICLRGNPRLFGVLPVDLNRMKRRRSRRSHKVDDKVTEESRGTNKLKICRQIFIFLLLTRIVIYLLTVFSSRITKVFVALILTPSLLPLHNEARQMLEKLLGMISQPQACILHSCLREITRILLSIELKRSSSSKLLRIQFLTSASNSRRIEYKRKVSDIPVLYYIDLIRVSLHCLLQLIYNINTITKTYILDISNIMSSTLTQDRAFCILQ